MAKLSNSILGLLPEAGRLVSKSIEDCLRAYNLTVAQLEILEMLWVTWPTPVSQAAIIRARGVEAATIGTTLARLERDGWIERLPDPDDRRGKLVRGTEKAKEMRDFVELQLVIVESRLTEFKKIETDLRDIIARLRGETRDD